MISALTSNRMRACFGETTNHKEKRRGLLQESVRMPISDCQADSA